MKKIWQGTGVVMLILFVVSCAPKYMVKHEPMQKPSEGKALVNFLRPSSTGGAAQVTIWDNDKLIGFTAGKMAFQYECDPGKHLFISWSEFKSPVEAELYHLAHMGYDVYRIESTISSCASGWAGGEQDYIRFQSIHNTKCGKMLSPGKRPYPVINRTPQLLPR